MKVTILGSSGQIGAYLTEYLRNKDYEVNEVTGNTFAPIQIHSSSSQHNLPDGIMEVKRPVPRSLGLESRKRDLKRTLNNDGEVCPVYPVKIQKKADLI